MEKMIKKDIVIIGAGASGLMLGSLLEGKDFLLLEKNFEIGKKLKVSGGGRCNITNKFISSENYLGNDDFLKEILSRFSYQELLKYFKGIEFRKEKSNQFFCKKGSSEILSFFKKKIPLKKIITGCEVKSVIYKDEFFYIDTSKRRYIAKKLIVASGGISFPQLGVSDVAYEIAKKFGHQVTTLKPALVGLTLQKDDFWMKNLSGISLPVKVSVGKKSFVSDMLFAHRGISGPAILNSSLYWEKGSIFIDFLPGYDVVFKDKKKQISSNLPLPKRFIKEFLKKLTIEDKVVSKLTDSELEKLNLLKNYKLSPAGDFGYKKAEVTKGGIKTGDICRRTMESKLQKNLYFLGECLDITGELGGYNLHFAFASAKICSLI